VARPVARAAVRAQRTRGKRLAWRE
jgi:hypothetical protein